MQNAQPVNARIAAVSVAKGQSAAKAAFAKPYRVAPLGKHPRLKPVAGGVPRQAA